MPKPWTEEPGRLQSMGSQRVWHDWAFSLSCIGERSGNPFQCSCLENPRDGEAWWAAIYEVAQSWRRLKRLSSTVYIIIFIFMRNLWLRVSSLSKVKAVMVSNWESDPKCALFLVLWGNGGLHIKIELVIPNYFLLRGCWRRSLRGCDLWFWGN